MLTEKILTLLSYPLIPLATPVWIFESLYRKVTKTRWEFGPYLGASYLAFLTITSIYLFLLPSSFLNIIAIYILSSLEILSLAGSFGIVIGNYNDYFSTLMKLARRTRVVNFGKRLNAIEFLYSTLSFGFTAMYFGILNNYLFRLDGTQYSGVQGTKNGEVLFDFIYSSFISMTTLGLTALTPQNILSKSFYMLETSISLLYLLLLFALLSNQIISFRQK